MPAVANRHQFQTQITTDAMLQMHDEIAVVQVGEINVECRARGLCMGRFLSAWSLDFVTAKNFRICDDDQFRFVANKAAGEGTDLNLGCGVVSVSRLVEPQVRLYGETMFFPDFFKALAFAVVVAENMNGVILSQPAMDLGEEFTALRFGDL